MAAPTNSTNRHEEVIGVDFDISKARANLGILQQAVDALKASVGGGGGGIPVALPGMPGVGAGLGGGATTSSTAVVGQQGMQGQWGGRQNVGGWIPTGPQQSATVSSGAVSGGGGGKSLWTEYEMSHHARVNRDADRAEQESKHARELAYSRMSQGSAQMMSAFSGAIASGHPAGMIGGGIGALGTMMNLPRPMSAILSGTGAVLTAGVGMLDDLGERRAGIERDFGITQLSGIGANQKVNLSSYAHDPFGVRNLGPLKTSGIDDYLRKAYRIGAYSPEEATGMASQYATSAGGMARGDKRGGFSDFLTMSLAGIDPGAAGALDRTRLLGGASGSAATTMGLAGLGQGGFGIQGALNEWMRSLASQIDRLIHKGMRVDTSSFERMLGRMAASPELSKLGLRAADVAGGMAGMAGSARERLLSPFSGLGQHAAMMEAISNSGDIFGAARYLEGMGPGEVADATGKAFGSQFAGASFAADLGVTMDQGEALAGMPRDGKSFGLRTADKRSRAMYAHRSGMSVRDVTDRAPSVSQDKLLVDAREATRDATIFAGKGVVNAAKGIADLVDTTEELKEAMHVLSVQVLETAQDMGSKAATTILNKKHK